jgi:hypothetical protein
MEILYFQNVCFCSLFVTADMRFNKPATKKIPYWLLREHFWNMIFETRHNINYLSLYTLPPSIIAQPNLCQ